MGYVAHDAVIVTTWLNANSLPDVEAFRQEMPEQWQHLLVGPIQSVVNGDTTWFFAPDGSKSGWTDDKQGAKLREQFVALFKLVPFGVDVVTLTYGADFRNDFSEPKATYEDSPALLPE